MNTWLDLMLVVLAVVASGAYAVYALGPRRIKAGYSRFATKHFGLRTAKWFAPKADDCSNCASRDQHLPRG